MRFLVLFAWFLSVAWSQYNKYGAPDCPGQLLDKTYYVICYDHGWKTARWVGYELAHEELAMPTVGRTDNFRADPEITDGPMLADYRKSGFDRGHLAPAGDFAWSKESMSATFVLSNMAPQRPGLNRGHWRELEMAVRTHVLGERATAYLFTAPTTMNLTAGLRSIGPSKVRIPHSFVKVMLCEHVDTRDRSAAPITTKHSIAAFAMNGDSAEIKFTSVDLASQATSLRFFEKAQPEILMTTESLPLVSDEISRQALRKFGKGKPK